MSGSVAGASGSGGAQQYHMSGAVFTALLIFTQLPGVLSYTIPLPLLAEMGKELAKDSTGAFLVKLIAGAIGPAMAVGSLAGGLLADRIDRRWLVMVLGVAYILAALAPYTVGAIEVIVATRIVVGATAGALMAIGFTMVGDYLPEDKRAGTIGMMSALNMITSLVSLPAAGFVAESGWRPAFLLYLAIVPLVALASPRALPVPGKHALAEAGEAAPQSGSGGFPWGLLLLAVAVGIILTVPGIYMSFHLGSIGIEGTSTVSMIFMANSLVAAVFSGLFGKACARLTWKWLFVLSFASMGFGLVLMAYAPAMGFAIAAMVIMGVGMGWLAPAIPAKAVESVDAGRRGTVVGIVQGVAAAAPLVALALLEPQLPSIGTRGVMLAVGGLALAFFAIYLVSRGEQQTAPVPTLH